MQKDRGILVWGELLLTGHRQTPVSAFPLGVLEKLVLYPSFAACLNDTRSSGRHFKFWLCLRHASLSTHSCALPGGARPSLIPQEAGRNQEAP